MSFVIAKNKLKKYIPEGETIVVIPEGVDSIGANVFKDCNQIESVVFPTSLNMIGQRAFSKCINLKNVIIPDNVRSIANYAFFGCESLRSLKLPEQLEKIGDSAFSGCIHLQEVSYPKHVDETGKYIFFNCDSLADENGFVVVNGILYTYCGNADVITVPDSVCRIEDRAFETKIIEQTCFGELQQVRNVHRVVLPSSVHKIGEHTFDGCLAEDIVSYGIPIYSFSTPELKKLAFIGYAREQKSFDSSPEIAQANNDYIGTYKKNYLPFVYENDFVEGIKVIAETGKIDLKEFDDAYLIPAQAANAVQCVTYLIQWRNNMAENQAMMR